MSSLTKEEIEALDPYSFLAALGKKVVRPGGHVSTEQLFELAEIKPDHHVLEVGCGVGATAIELVQRFGCEVTAIDHSRLMLEKAEELTRTAGLMDRIHYQEADMCGLPYEDDTFDVVVIEAVTMFCPRIKAISECKRVLKPGGQLLDQEFAWIKAPDEHALEILRQPKMCPGIEFDDVREWKLVFKDAGMTDVEATSGPFALMHPRVFLKDEGWANSMRILGKALSRPAYIKKSVWLMRNIMEIMPSLGYVVVSARKPALVPGRSTAPS
ncbi:MAG: methyltransferase domain-containing protein [Actinobacteria bacterium]|nr:methyltransferase domain-containing protein [Actinomycetota bacterium]